MKLLLFCFISILLCYGAGAQPCTAPVITPSGPTTICSGGSITLSAPPADKAWTKKADLAGPARMGAVGFSIGSKGYIGTGAASLVDASSVKKDFWEYDPATDAWTQKADFSGSARSYATGFSIGGKGYVGTGTDGSSFVKDFWEYDPTINAWAQKADFGGSARSNATGFSIGSKGYIGTGITGSTPANDFWEYNSATDAWTQKTDFGGTARSGATGFSIGGKGYIGTGYEGGTSYKKDFWEYNPLTNVWMQRADFGGAARGYAAGISIDSMGYIGTGSYTSSGRGGVITYNSFNDFWEYNTTTNAWIQKANYGGSGPERTAGFTIGSKGYVGTGRAAVDPYTGITLKDLWEYGPSSTYLWSPGGETTPSITVTTSGNYTVTTTNAQGCSATSTVTTVKVFSTTLYVDNSRAASGDGSSWATAYKELREALRDASQCTGTTTILVAAGTYKPTSENNRDTSFLLRGGLKLYGGYPSGGGNRNITANPTILSGNIGNENNPTDNSYHVIVIAGLGSSADSVVVDGFTITAGNGDGNFSKLYNGISVNRSGGGGMYLESNSDAGGKIAVRNCTFNANWGDAGGGAIYNNASSPTFTNCLFINNFAGAGRGGAMYNNIAAPIVTNCIFSGNVASGLGGGMCNVASSAVVINCIFSSNRGMNGGGMANSRSSSTITNCTFSANNATNAGGGIFNTDSSSSIITNCIIWNNINGSIINNASNPSVSYSDVQGTGLYPGTGNINADPLFVDLADPNGADNIFRTADDGLQLTPNSPAINKGSNAAVPAGITTDVTGVVRIQQAIVDLGAYESPYTAENCSDDKTPPIITSKNTTVYLDASGRATIQPFDVIGSLTDNCSLDSASFLISQSSFSCTDLAASDSIFKHQAYVAGTSTGNQAWKGELGMEFTVNKRIYINQLGAFDHQGNGINGTQNGGIRVAIFNRTTQTIVPGLDAIVSAQGDAFVSNYRLKNIAPVTLLPGNYVLVAKGYNPSELNGNAALGSPVTAGDNADGAISYTGFSRYGFDDASGFSYPQNTDNGPAYRYLAGTFFFSIDPTPRQAYRASLSSGVQAWKGELGMEFSVNKRILVNQLGAFDHQGNGINGTQNGGIRVAIFNKATQTIVPGLDAIVSGQGNAYSANHRLINITPVTLLPGNYVVVAKGYNSSERNGNAALGSPIVAGDNADSAISYTGSSLYGDDTDNGFGYPQYTDNGPANRYQAGTFVYQLAERAGSKIVTITASDSKGNTATTAALVIIKEALGACNSSSAAPAAVQQVQTTAEVEPGSAIRLYPNPAKDRFTLQFSGMRGVKGMIEVMDINGRVLEQRVVSFTGKTSSQTQVFSMSAQPSGVYFVRVKSDEGVRTLKVIVAR